MLYTQIFQELYYQADFNCGGRLPIHVTFMLDEFANVALPDDFCSLLSTMRSREISSIIIIQNFAQLKALFKDTWETIPGNCDTFIYLGGNEQSTHKYVSELLGKGKDTYHCSHWCCWCHHSCKECHGVRTSLSAAGFIYYELCTERNCSRCHDGWYFNSSDILRLLRLGKCISPFSKRKEVNNKYGYF